MIAIHHRVLLASFDWELQVNGSFQSGTGRGATCV